MRFLNCNCINLSKVFLAILVCLAILTTSACDTHKEPIQIGYVGGLTGRVAGLGIAGRDGALFAVEEANKTGGINGRQVVLLVKDDRQNAEAARQAVRELIEAHVVGIIGHMTSSMTAVTLPIINEAKKVMISPTSKSDLFSHQDDYFFRVTAASSNNAEKVANLAVNKMAVKTIAIIYDRNNKAFTESWMEQFRRPFEALGGKVVNVSGFSSGDANLSFYDLINEIIPAQPGAYLILASALDTALASQQLMKLGSRVPVFASEWSFTSDVLNFGGQAVEGMTSYHSFNADSQRPQYLAHKKIFVKRFGYAPSFASVLAYDATKLLLSAVKVNPAPDKMKDTLLGLGTFAGLQSDIKFDEFGDVSRQLFHTVIVNGQFRVVD